ncbi:MAG: hypothetical protein QOC73_1793, partial [Actinomycetota bacterium]|nr:hypothetical protein [Actinomycetota bacterium]
MRCAPRRGSLDRRTHRAVVTVERTHMPLYMDRHTVDGPV